MRICVLAKHIPPHSTDGIARNRWLYAKLFQQRGWEVHLITLGADSVEEFKDGIYIHEVAVNEADLKDNVFNRMALSVSERHMLAYSYAVYKRVKKIASVVPIDCIDNSLWGLEGLITKIKLPTLRMLTRVDTTTRLIREINGTAEEVDEFSVQNELETFLLQNSDLLVFNSWSILKETERLYQMSFAGKPYAIINHGISIPEMSSPDAPILRQGQQSFRVFVPGRMEKRKGTKLLIQEALPGLLNTIANVEIHFAGKDHAEWDGFKEETGLTYSQYIKESFQKEIGTRIFLHDYVSDEQLAALYQKADCVLAPSLYESFGLVYLEAAAFGKPLIALNRGAVTELFVHNEDALLVDPNKPDGITNALAQLQKDKQLATFLVSNAKRKLLKRFNPQVMVDKCIQFIHSVVDSNGTGTVYQLMNSLVEGDGVSTFARDYDYVLKMAGYPTQIMGSHCAPALRHLSQQIHEFNFGVDNSVLYHYCGCCEWSEYLNSLDLPVKTLFFHNITPPSFFEPGTSEYNSVTQGWRQLPSLDNFDLYVALSQYSLNVLQQAIPKKLNTMVMPMLVDRDLILQRPYNKELTSELRANRSLHILFVGRIWTHKKQLDLLRFAQHFKNTRNRDFHISIVGGGMVAYREMLLEKIKEWGLTNYVTLTGKVPDDALYAYYRSADVYLSMSEHEGFGTPLVEAMVFDVPVVAYGVTAIPETVGNNECVFYEKNFEQVALIVDKLSDGSPFRQHVLQLQHRQLDKYSHESVRAALEVMGQKARGLHAARLNKLRNENKLFSEDFYNYKDNRIAKQGAWRVADGRTLIHYGDDDQSWLEIEAEFDEVDFFFVNHEKSGRAAIYFNNQLVRHFDLYAPAWTVRRFTLKNNKPAVPQQIRIVPTGEKNAASQQCEVLFYGMRVKKRGAEQTTGIYSQSALVPAGMQDLVSV